MFPVAVSTPPGVPFDPAPFAGLPLAPTAFPADGRGGRELEAAVKVGRFAGVLDLCLAELAADIHGQIGSAGPDRLTAAALAGVPQVIAPGLADWFLISEDPNAFDGGYWGCAIATSPAGLRVRVIPKFADRIGQDIAQKACAAKGSTVILLPLAGLSSFPDRDPEADAALFQSIRNWVYGVEIVELDLAADDPRFVRAAAERLAAMLAR